MLHGLGDSAVHTGSLLQRMCLSGEALVGEGHRGVGERGVWEVSVPCVQVYCESKTAVKHKVY